MDTDTIVGIVLILLGILVLVGELSVGVLLNVLGLALVVLGILILGDVLTGGNVLGIAVLVLGLLIYLERVGVPGQIAEYVNLIVGVVLLVLGLREL